MSFSFGMFYKPGYQKRFGKCKVCTQGIEAGAKIMIGTGFFHGRLIKNHNHYNCWLREVVKRASLWYFANDYKPKRMAPEIKAELNRLRAKRYYVTKKGGEPTEIAEKLAEINLQIKFAKTK